MKRTLAFLCLVAKIMASGEGGNDCKCDPEDPTSGRYCPHASDTVDGNCNCKSVSCTSTQCTDAGCTWRRNKCECTEPLFWDETLCLPVTCCIGTNPDEDFGETLCPDDCTTRHAQRTLWYSAPDYFPLLAGEADPTCECRCNKACPPYHWLAGNSCQCHCGLKDGGGPHHIDCPPG
jgi:hypothetical protein